MKIVWWFVAFSKVLRQTLLSSLFGSIISECKHSPSCSEYLVQAVRKEGILKGAYKGFSRIITCY